ACARSPPMTITDGLKKLTAPASTSPTSRPAWRTSVTAWALPARTSATTSRLVWASTPMDRGSRARAPPLATASTQARVAQGDTVAPAALGCCVGPVAPRGPTASGGGGPPRHDPAADPGGNLQEQQVVDGVAPA